MTKRLWPNLFQTLLSIYCMVTRLTVDINPKFAFLCAPSLVYRVDYVSTVISNALAVVYFSANTTANWVSNKMFKFLAKLI